MRVVAEPEMEDQVPQSRAAVAGGRYRTKSRTSYGAALRDGVSMRDAMPCSSATRCRELPTLTRPISGTSLRTQRAAREAVRFSHPILPKSPTT